jgi:hypothetical protein
MATRRAIMIPAPIPAPIPALAAVERPLWVCALGVGVMLGLVSLGLSVALVDSAALTVDAEGFAFALMRMAWVGWGP